MRLQSMLAAVIVALMFTGMLPATGMVPSANAFDGRQEPTCEDGFGSPICVFLHPGIVDNSKPGWSHTLDTLWGTQDGSGQTRQVFDRYLDYAILASASDSIGDLQFDIQVLESFSVITLYIPPEFKWLGPASGGSIWTDITSDYKFIDPISVGTYDGIAPDWTRVQIGKGRDDTPSSYHTVEPGVYHIRVFDLGAPEVAGLYHFKIYVDGVSIGAGNFPIIIVKSELNPAWVEATVRTELYFNPPLVSGQVVAEGTTSEGRAVKAQAYWGPNEFVQNVFTPDMYGNGGAEYRTYLFGLAEGTYDLTAYASGMVPKTTERLTVLAGQSYHMYMTVFDSPDLFATIWSKHGTGETIWHNLWQLPYGTNNPAAAPDDLGPHRDTLIELYDSDNNLVSFWASTVLPPAKYFSESNMLLGYHDDIVDGFAPGYANRAMAGLTPTKSSYSVHLVDNFDLLGSLRGYPSTQWDGHVPWDTADYVSGILNGAYTLEAFVTGYIMDEADAYQRSFVVSGIEKTVPFDLRRTNWIEPVMHLPSGLVLSGDTTVTLTAEDADGEERAAIAFYATPEMCDDGVIDGRDASSINSDGSYAGGIMIEGWNAVFPNLADESGFRDIRMKDYGLNPTASTHSAGAVSLAGNPYTVKLYMADMGVPYQGVVGTGWYNIVGGDPQVSVFLCNSPQSLSFTIRPAWLEIGLRSVDFQVPAHSRPWTFPGAEIRLDFADVETGEAVGKLDPVIYGLIQDPGTVEGMGFDIPGNPFGADGVTPFDVDNVNDAGRHERLAVTYTGIDYCQPGIIGAGMDVYYALMPYYRPTRLPPGEYTLSASTHGYVMRRSFPVQVPSEGGADIGADLIQGGQIRVVMDFKNEGVATDFNGFVRVEVFDANDALVGASIYGQAEPNVFTRSVEGGAYFDYDETNDWTLASVYGYTPSGFPEPAQATGFDESYDAYPSASHAQRAYYSSVLYGVPADTWAGWSWTNPSDANRLQVPAGQRQAFDIYGFYWYYGDAARTWAGGWPTTNGDRNIDYGLKGTNDIPNWSGSGGGLYTVKVWAFDPYGPDNMFESEGASDDWRMYSMATELTDVEVLWGGATVLLVTMNNMATLRGTVRWLDMLGNLRALPWAQVTASPGPDSDSSPAYTSGLGAVGAGASDPGGAYIMWLPAGTHDVSVSTSEAPGVWGGPAEQNAQSAVVVTDGWVGGGDVRLDHSEGVPVPELPALLVPFGLLAALAASVWLIRRRNLNAPLLMK